MKDKNAFHHTNSEIAEHSVPNQMASSFAPPHERVDIGIFGTIIIRWNKYKAMYQPVSNVLYLVVRGEVWELLRATCHHTSLVGGKKKKKSKSSMKKIEQLWRAHGRRKIVWSILKWKTWRKIPHTHKIFQK